MWTVSTGRRKLTSSSSPSSSKPKHKLHDSGLTFGHWLGFYTAFAVVLIAVLAEIVLAVVTLYFLWGGQGWHALVALICIFICGWIMHVAWGLRPRTKTEQLIEAIDSYSAALRRNQNQRSR